MKRIKKFLVFDDVHRSWWTVKTGVWAVECPELHTFAVHKAATTYVGNELFEGYVVTEPQSGLAVTKGRTRKEAVENFRADLAKRGVKAYQRQIKKALKLFGPTVNEIVF